jgi:hypothetical protein
MDWRTSDEQPNFKFHPDGGLARDAGHRPMAGVPDAAVAQREHRVVSLDAASCRALQLARATGARFGGEGLSE